MFIQIVYQIINILIGGMIFGVAIMSWLFLIRWRNAREIEGKILCHFFGASGWYYMLCEAEGSSIRPPEGHKMQGNYFISNDCLYMGKWKPGQPKFAQVGISCTAYIENEREPVVSTDPERWIKNPEKHKITAFMQRVAINEAAMKTAQVLQMGVWKDIASMANFIKRVPLMFILSLGTVGLLLFILYLNYSILQAVSAILQRGY